MTSKIIIIFISLFLWIGCERPKYRKVNKQLCIDRCIRHTVFNLKCREWGCSQNIHIDKIYKYCDKSFECYDKSRGSLKWSYQLTHYDKKEMK